MDTSKQSPAWARALEWFEGGFGDPPDLTDGVDRGEFLRLLETTIRQDIEAELAATIRAATERLRGSGEIEP